MSPSFRFVTHVLAIASCSALGLSCAETKLPASPVAGERPTPSDRPAMAAATTSDVHISEDIRSKCGISDADAYFPFNSSLVTTRARTPLDLVVQCFTSGPLKGHAVKLVGRADPRGPSDYNMTLGQWRADAVEGYLTTRGMQKSRSLATSRGSMDATGNDEVSWQRDRRVDILIGD